MVVSAGNSRRDACVVSPASVPGVITTGAVDITRARWVYSNWWGESLWWWCVCLFVWWGWALMSLGWVLIVVRRGWMCTVVCWGDVCVCVCVLVFWR